MRLRTRFIAAFVAIVIVLGTFGAVTHAAGLGVSVGSGTVKPGSTISIKVKFSGTDIFGATADFTYDKSLLKYVGGANTSDGKIVLYGSQSGASSLSCTIKFKALKEGKAKITVKCTESYNSNLVSLGTGSASGTVTIRKPEPDPTPIPDVTVDTPGGSYIVCGQLPDGVDIPSGFEANQTTLSGGTVFCANSPQGITIVYVREGDGGRFMLLLPDGALSDFAAVSIAQNFWAISPGEEFTLPDGFDETSIRIAGVSVTGYTDGVTTLVYGYCNGEGPMLFSLDTSTGAIFAYTPVEPTPEPTSETTPEPTPIPVPTSAPESDADEKEEKGFSKDTVMLLLIGIAVLGIVCAVLVILLVSLRRCAANVGRDV